MTQVFVTLLNMSLSAGWFVLAVLLLRLLLRRAPKWILCLLWGLVALRLIVPVWPESSLSLIPSPELIPKDFVVSDTPAIHSGIPAVNDVVNPVLSNTQGLSLQSLLSVAAVLWLVGVAGMVLYSAVSYLPLRRQVVASLPWTEGVYLCDNIDTPFILGVFRPRIYIPSGLLPGHLEYVVAHEMAHLRRRDHWWKPFGFTLLTVYWFNPLMWLAYILLCRDIEQACDEKAVRDMDIKEKKEYSETLAACSFQRRLVMVCPLAFGEVAVKDRIRAVLKYKKPVFWVVAAAVAVCIAAAVCFLSNPMPCKHSYIGQITLAATCRREGVETFTCADCWDSYTKPMPMLSHLYAEGVQVRSATCTEQGVISYTCTQCNTEKREQTEIIAHAFGEAVITKEPSCTEEGVRESNCSMCMAVTSEKIERLPHTFGEAVITKEPNCTEKGVRAVTCELCSEIRVVEELETNDVHDMQNNVIREATCTVSGEGISQCTRCDYSEKHTYEALGHHYVEGMTLPATCSTDGKKEFLCSNCGAAKYETLPKTDEHKWKDMGLYWPDRCVYCGEIRDNDEVYSSGYSLLDGVTGNSGSDGNLPALPVVEIWP